MKLTLKILKLLAILILTISLILFSASLFLQNKVSEIVLRSLNSNISTKLSATSFRLSFLKKFPKASVELKNVLVRSSSDFNSKSFKGINTDTLLTARTLSVEFKITDILKGIYDIQKISAKEGRINLYSDQKGNVNYDISTKKEVPGGGSFTIDLERIYLSDIYTRYINLATKLNIEGVVENGRLKSRISGSEIDFTAIADLQIERFRLNNTVISKTISAGLDLTLTSTKKGVLFKKGKLRIENYNFGLEGFVSSANILDLNIEGNNIDLSRVRNYLPEKYRSLISDYNLTGILLIKSKIKGLLSRTSNPHIETNFSLNNGLIKYNKSDLTINDLSFSGYYSNGAKNCAETSSLSIRELKAKLGSSEYTGSIVITGFSNPKTELQLKGRVFPGELKNFFGLTYITAAEGSVDVEAKLNTDFWPKEKITLNDIIDLKADASLVFNSLNIGLNDNKLLLKNITGKISISDKINAENLQFIYKGQKIKVSGEFQNLPEWLAGRPVQLIASADVSCGKIIPELFIIDSVTSSKNAFTFPGDVFLDLNFKIDSLDYKTFSSTRISGTINYKPRLLTFTSLNMKSLNGMISGNGFIVQNNIKSLIARANFNISDIDVNKGFTTFHNFGQDFIKAENIAGRLSGTLSVFLPMDSLLHPEIKTITAEGKYQLTNGSLVNFDPVKQLSSFIELSELENIHFEKLENDFFIRNNILYIPQMEVKSSAVDLSVNGKHSFDNTYEYHIKMLLSEILSRKRKKNKNNISDFGVVEDDGLGRTKLLLKIENKGKEVKVGYDLKAAGGELKNNIKAERQSLKSLLNKEYGWFKNDSVPKQKQKENKSKFRISFGETDSVKPTLNSQTAKKQNKTKKVFKIE